MNTGNSTVERAALARGIYQKAKAAMTEQTTGTCQLIPVDARELRLLRKFHAHGRVYMSCEITIEGMDELYDRMTEDLKQLEPWKDAPIPEEWQ